MKRFILERAAALSVIWALLIFILCATPGQYIPSVNWLEALSFDKWVHAVIFFILCCFLFLAGTKHFAEKQNIKHRTFFILAILYGLLLEMMQALVFANRSADWLDVLANTFGCLAAFALRKKLIHWIAEA